MRQKRHVARKERREQHAGSDTEQDAHKRDADLRDRERILWRIEDGERGARIFGVVAFLIGEAFEAALVSLHQRRFDE